MAGNWDVFMRQVEQSTLEMERFMAHVDEARAATLSSVALAPTTIVLWHPAVNVYETADAVVVQAELAGVAPEEMTIQYDAGHLLVWGRRREIINAEPEPPDTPVFVLHFYNRALLNQAAVRAVGYTKETPDPQEGRFSETRTALRPA